MIQLISEAVNKKALRVIDKNKDKDRGKNWGKNWGKNGGTSALPLTLMLLFGILDAHAEPTTIHCTFGTCQVEVTPDNMLEISCEGRAMYAGPYVINTEYRTIRIQGVTANSPRITTQSLASSGASNKATLYIGGRDIEGACRVGATTLADTPTHDS